MSDPAEAIMRRYRMNVAIAEAVARQQVALFMLGAAPGLGISIGGLIACAWALFALAGSK